MKEFQSADPKTNSVVTAESSKFDLDLHPVLQRDPALATSRKVDIAIEALEPDVQIQGWFLSPANQEIRGLRVSRKDTSFVARRKRLTPEVRYEYPLHPDSLKAGFQVDVHLETGWNDLVLEYKDENGKWRQGATLAVKLSKLWKLLRKTRKPHHRLSPYQEWCAQNEVSSEELPLLRAHAKTLAKAPLISVLMPVYNPPPFWLARAMDAILEQVYEKWELCIADDASTDPEVVSVLKAYAAKDSRIKLMRRPKNGHISAASNDALALCSGEFTALYDHDDEIPPTALYFAALEILQHPEAAIIFTDEDKIDTQGRRLDPYFKNKYNFDLFLQENCVSHLGVYRTSLLKEIGGFRVGYEGSQDWDLAFRAAVLIKPDQIRHIPRVLYHWRLIPSSTSTSSDAKPYAAVAGMKTVKDVLAGMDPEITADFDDKNRHRISWNLPTPLPSVSFLVIVSGISEAIKSKVTALRAMTSWPELEIVLIDTRGREMASQVAMWLHGENGLAHVTANESLGVAALYRAGAAKAHGDIVILTNLELKAPDTNWVEDLVRQAMRSTTGAVGPCLMNVHGAIHSAGLALDSKRIAIETFRNGHASAVTLSGRPDLVRQVAALSGECLAMRRSSLLAVGGLADTPHHNRFWSVDLCLRLRAAGMTNLFTPHSILIQPDTALGEVETDISQDNDVLWMKERWEKELSEDPYFNKNLSLEKGYPTLASPQFEKPWLASPSSR